MAPEDTRRRRRRVGEPGLPKGGPNPRRTALPTQVTKCPRHAQEPGRREPLDRFTQPPATRTVRVRRDVPKLAGQHGEAAVSGQIAEGTAFKEQLVAADAAQGDARAVAGGDAAWPPEGLRVAPGMGGFVELLVAFAHLRAIVSFDREPHPAHRGIDVGRLVAT